MTAENCNNNTYCTPSYPLEILTKIRVSCSKDLKCTVELTQ